MFIITITVVIVQVVVDDNNFTIGLWAVEQTHK
jgi:hypothetical protein